MIYDSSTALWTLDIDNSTDDFKLVKSKEVNSETLTPAGVVLIVNKSWPKIQIKYFVQRSDTIVISIPESEVLTQRMGTMGAEQFMSSTTYSFTELTDVNYVKYEFEAGVHALPGVYSRESWNAQH